ncbi:MAG: lytic transglycosylase, partial [Porphyromonas sp.]
MMNHIPSGIRLSYNSVVRESIELYLFRRRPLLSAMMSLGDLYFPDIEAELDRHHLPLELKYLTIVESALNPSAISPAGAAGLWQFMLPSARIYGLTVNSLVDERMDPVKGTEAACKMLSDLYRIYKDWWLVMAAYNCGPGNVNRALARAGGSGKTFWDIYNYLPRETRRYVPLYIGVYFAMHYAKQYGIRPRELGRTLATEYYQVK